MRSVSPEVSDRNITRPWSAIYNSGEETAGISPLGLGNRSARHDRGALRGKRSNFRNGAKVRRVPAQLTIQPPRENDRSRRVPLRSMPRRFSPTGSFVRRVYLHLPPGKWEMLENLFQH